ncbi:unnamed protein product [Linum tenue]|uniref:AMP-activated protein kinase glycogen-binding domain-containing protein n=1 Tax=Linum tenue TaxID=586396 RepID=A0AAV0HQE7_9ROSI|nr:unnamed protein product [Linum tenue]
MHSAAAVKTRLFVPPPNSLLPGLSSRTFPVSVFAVCRSRVAVVVGGGGCGGREQEKTASNVLSLHRAAPLKEEGPLLGFLDARKRNVRDSCWEFDDGFVRRCSKDWGGEGDSALEAEVFEFMKNSENPEMFPSKKQLIDAGRTDLVIGISRQGGWMASGWDLESEAEVVLEWKTGSESRASLSVDKKAESDQEPRQEASPLRLTSHSTASSPPRSLETVAEDDPGIDAMLSRLEIQRKADFGFKMPERSKVTLVPGHHPEYDEPSKASKASTVADMKNISESASLKRNKNDHSRAGSEPFSTQLRHTESKLSAIVNPLKSGSGDNLLHKAMENAPDKHLELYDAWEFQETGIMKRQNKLRSIRAKIAIVEGRMALAILDAQRLVEQKQKRIDHVQKGTELLRNAYITLPTEASEVFVAGSFDGWATKRKMFRSATCIFSLFLKLYPGKYEIKFIVDGNWKVDPLRPVVQHSGYVNNLFIVD